MGQFSALEHQLCNVHALQLAVCNLLYSPINVPDVKEENTDFGDDGDENSYNMTLILIRLMSKYQA